MRQVCQTIGGVALFFYNADFVGFRGGSSRDPRVVPLHPVQLSNGALNVRLMPI
jgi:hypothetical protein